MTIDELAKRIDEVRGKFNENPELIGLILDLEKMLVNAIRYHRDYVEWATSRMYKSNAEVWEDRMGGQFTVQEILNAKNNEW